MANTFKLDFERLLFPRNRILGHVLFWVLYLAYFTLSYASFRDNYLQSFTEVFCTLPTKMGATYLTLYWLIPRFLDQKKYWAFTIWFLLVAVAIGYLDRWIIHLYYVPKYLPNYDYATYPMLHFGKALQRTTNVYTIVFAAAAIKLIKRNYQNEKIAQELSREKLDAELKFLKAQIHPHFLFNTLNTLYSLTLQNSPRSAEVVLKLSNLLDYMLYDCNVPRISLRKEVNQVKNLIELERLRYSDRLEVDFTLTGDVKNQQVPPLLMLPFIENAFKHGVSKKTEDAFIHIDLRVKEDTLILRVENSSSPDDNGSQEKEYTKGIGLRNVRRRLDLIYGPEKYDLQVFNEEDTFMIVLRIPLTQKEENTPLAKPETPVPLPS